MPAGIKSWIANLARPWDRPKGSTMQLCQQTAVTAGNNTILNVTGSGLLRFIGGTTVNTLSKIVLTIDGVVWTLPSSGTFPAPYFIVGDQGGGGIGGGDYPYEATLPLFISFNQSCNVQVTAVGSSTMNVVYNLTSPDFPFQENWKPRDWFDSIWEPAGRLNIEQHNYGAVGAGTYDLINVTGRGYLAGFSHSSIQAVSGLQTVNLYVDGTLRGNTQTNIGPGNTYMTRFEDFDFHSSFRISFVTTVAMTSLFSIAPYYLM